MKINFLEKWRPGAKASAETTEIAVPETTGETGLLPEETAAAGEIVPVSEASEQEPAVEKENGQQTPEEETPIMLEPLVRVKPSLSRGLTREQVENRIAHGATNRPVDSENVTLKDIVKENVFTYFNLIFLIIAILLIVVGSYRDLTFLPIIIANAFIGIFQEWRSKKTLDKLTILSAPKTRTIRAGEEQVVNAEELVLDDLVIFEAGNQIPADAVVEEGEVQVNESLLTGEADEIAKKPGDSLLSGSFIVSGQCKARLDKVGEDSYISKLTLEAKARKNEEESEMIRSLDRLVKIIGVLIIPISILLFSQQFFINGQSLRSSVTATVAAVIGMIPEGLYLLASVAMAVSVMRLAMGKVLVHNMKSIETLARVDVLCVDKTGTITENTMTVKRAIPLKPVEKRQSGARTGFSQGAQGQTMPGWEAQSGTQSQPAPGWESQSGIQSQAAPGWESQSGTQSQSAPGWEAQSGTQSQPAPEQAAQNAARNMAEGLPAQRQSAGGISQGPIDAAAGGAAEAYRQTAEAAADGQREMRDSAAGYSREEPIEGVAREIPLEPEELLREAAAEQSPEEVPEPEFTPEELASLELQLGDFVAGMSSDNITMKAMQSYFQKHTGRRPDQIFGFSPATKYSGAVFGEKNYVLGAPEFLLRSAYEDYQPVIQKYSAQGYRVLIFGRYQGILDGKPLTAPVTPLGMILLANPVRENAPETFRYFAEQGVTIKVISGDNPVTVSEVAKEAGIENGEKYVDASTLHTEEEIFAAADEYTVFGRVSPEQKRQLIGALKKHGHTVAMTGDGVNDVLALKDADCSIAMASGSDAATHAAQMVLLESDFSKMPSVVAEGRRVVNNIERTASLFLVKNIFSILMSVFSIVFMMNYPLEPSQISLISMFTIGIPAFMMSLEQNKNRIQGHFLSNVFFRALPAGLTDFAVISSLVVFCQVFGVSDTDLSTSCTVLMAIVGIMILYRIASPMTKYHWALWLAMIFGLLFCMTFMNHIFAISSLSLKSEMLLVIFAIITEPLLRYLSILVQKLWDLAYWIRRKINQRREAKAA